MRRPALRPPDLKPELRANMIRNFFAAITRNAVSMLGAILAIAAGVLIVTFFVMELLGYQGGPYLGILTYLLLPMVMVLGLLLVPFGFWWERRREKKAAARGEEVRPLPVIDLNSPKTRGTILVFVLGTLVSTVILAGATYKGVEYMESTEFCGLACHKVMQPEYTAHQRSPHSRVACADCHIGAGADWFVKSKISGSWQLIAVAFDLYPRPIGAPVHNLRPARETCEQCHTPTKFVGDRLRVHTHYQDDEQNTALKNVLMVKVGGQQGKASSGIHWHVDRGVQIRYLGDRSREKIYTIELKGPDGSLKTFKGEDAAPADGEWRTMDCIDCHNRPTHIYRQPAQEIDSALEDGRIDTSLPFVKREGMRILQTSYNSHDEARVGIEREVEKFYRANYPDVVAQRASAVKQAGKALGDIYCWNVFPQMKVTWDTYPNHIGHNQSPGCYRCHDNKHKTESGEKISKKCSTCHNVVAEDEADPEVLKKLTE
jgi:nitrate/TMAO reductase-like tetraheme cytochrome c subunit